MPRISNIVCLLMAALLPLHSQATTAMTTPSTNTTGFPPCDALIRAGLRSRLLLATDAAYEPRIASWWALNARQRPWCLVQPRSTAEVSLALTTLLDVDDGAGGDWHIAIRSGGHGPGPGANNVDAGVTVDLGALDGATYDAATNVAGVGAGGRWGDVYAKLRGRGVAVPGGRDGGVGVGGFLLGGGLTYFMGREAFGCDAVRNFEVVLADGSVVDANRDENADLWRALKGGGGNFGVVTRFDMEALPDRDVAYGVRLMDGSRHSAELVDALVRFTDGYERFDGDAMVAFVMHNTSISEAGPVAAAIHVNVDGVHNSSGFEELSRIPPLEPDETRSVKLADAAEASQLSSGAWNAQATLTLPNDPLVLNHALALHDRLIADLSGAIGASAFQSIAFLQPLPSFLGAISARKGGNMLGLDDSSQNAIIWTGSVAVTTDRRGLAIARARLMALAAELKAFAEGSGGGGGAAEGLVYMNYADASQDPLGSYGAGSVAFMRRVAERYDPTGAFQTRVPGGFKISRVGDV